MVRQFPAYKTTRARANSPPDKECRLQPGNHARRGDGWQKRVNRVGLQTRPQGVRMGSARRVAIFGLLQAIPYVFNLIGVPGEIRTHGPQIRNLVLYPAELRGQPLL